MPTAERGRGGGSPGRETAAGLAVAAGLTVARLALGGLRRARHGRPRVRPAALTAGHETTDANIRAIVWVGVGLLATVALALVVVTAMQADFVRRPISLGALPGLAPQPTVQLPPEPRLESVPGQTLQELRAAQQQQLETYRWVDRQGGTAQIPIEQAIDLLSQRGLPARSADEARRFQDQGLTRPSGSSSGRASESRWP